MMRSFFENLLLVWMMAGLLSGCAGRLLTPVALPKARALIAAATATATRIPAFTATLSGIPLSTATPTPAAIRSNLVRPPSGWTLYSNPDFVRGVALYERQLWAATSGGVVAWDLNTEKPTLYTTRDGLDEIQGNDIVYCPAPQKRILVAHSSGMLSAYDLTLKKWSRIPITFGDGSTLSSVQTMYCDAPNQRLIVGSAEGLGILNFKTGFWRRIGPAEGLKVDTILSINVVGQAIWVAAGDKSAFMIMGNSIFPFNAASGFPVGSVYDISVAADGSIWLGYSTGLVHYHDKLWNFYGSQTSSGIPFRSVEQVEVGADKRIWIASAEEGVCPFNPITFFCSTVYPGSQGMPITDLAVGEDGVAYAGTNGGGILIMSATQVRHLAFNQQQLMSNDIRDIQNSPDGMVWVVTDRGINDFDPGHPKDPWQSFKSQRTPLAFPRVSGLLPAANGMWFFYDQEAQASFFDGGKWLQINALKGLNGPVQDALVDQRGYTWFATNHGINLWDGTVMRTYMPADDLRGNNFHAIFERDGKIWAGSERGLLRYLRYQWQVVLPDLSIQTIAPDDGSGLLLGTRQGLIRFDGIQSFIWVINFGNEVLVNPDVTSIAWDGNHQLWVGTDGQGLLHYDGTHWEQFNTASGLPTNRVRKVITDRLGTIWIVAITGEGGGALVRYVP